jgi:steroid delta-isomerase
VRSRRSIALIAGGALLLGAVGASAQPEAEIRSALAKWTDDFNKRDASRICDLFTPDLRYDYRGFPERGYDAICSLLRRSLGDPAKTFTYRPDIKEIIVSGDFAVVRLVWTLTVSVAGSSQTTETREPGLDVFRRQADGSWKIVRYMGYEEP